MYCGNVMVYVIARSSLYHICINAVVPMLTVIGLAYVATC